MEAWQDALCSVLFSNMRVPSISFVDTHTLALLAVGRTTGLVVDCGYWETVVMPVYAGRPLYACLATTPRAGRRLEEAADALVRGFSRTAGASIDTQLTTDVRRRIVTEALVVGALPPMLCDASLPLDTDAFQAMYGAEDTATDFTLRTAHGTLTLPGWIRTAACEAVWEEGDEDETGIVACARESVRKLPLDARRDVLDAVLLTGGTAQLPGFADRFSAQWAAPAANSANQPPHTDHAPRGLPSGAARVLNGGGPKALRMPPHPPSLLAWIGGSLAARVGMHGTHQLTRHAWRAAPTAAPVPDPAP